MQAGASRAEAIGAGCRASTTGLSPGVVLREDGIIPGSGIRTDGKAAVKAPGADASTVDVDTLWNSMTRWLLTSRSQLLRRFVHSSFLQQDDGAQSTHTPRPVWPIPLPYRGKLHSGTAREKSFARALNLFVICMNWLHLGQPSKPPRDFNPYASLTSEQIGIVKRLKLLALEWKNSTTVTAEDMGRSAGKFEQLEKTLGVLTQRAMVLVRSGGSGNMRTPHVGRHQPGGSATLLSEVSIAKEIESQRLQFRGVPSFDPTNLLDEETRSTYVDPVAAAISPEESCQDPPFVQVRGRRTEIMKLFRKLDQSNRLALFTEEQVRMQYRSGLFALMKDLEKDRLILDARPANQLEFGLTTWTSTMGSVVPLLSLQLLPEQVLACSGEDLRDYYYYFCISPARALRNAIRYELTLEEAKQFGAYGKAVPGRRRYIPALNTMAMGDINAVEVGQEAHVKLAFRAGVRLSDLITLRGRLPRGGPYVGIVIDDFITISAVPRPLQDTTEAAMLADKMVEIYGTAGLLAHDGKRFRDALHAKFWGASLDGEAGTLRFQLEKVLPLAMLTSQLARLGWSNRKLLEVLSGAWIAALQCRRRCTCLLEVVFDEIQLHGYEENFPLSPAAIDELWTLVICCPWFVTDLRAAYCTEFSLVDASNEWEAEVSTQVSPALAEELGRQRLTKAAWSRLLTPLQAVRRMNGTLTPDEEVPTGETAAVEHPLWTGIVKSSTFSMQWRRRVRGRPHINVSEMTAALRSEARRARRFPGHRILTGSDSQVTLGALIKGRSSSKVLNQHLKRFLPQSLAYNVYNYTQYIGTADNVADDPTRDRRCRPPSMVVPDWIASIDDHDYGGLETVLLARGLDDGKVARTPPPEGEVSLAPAGSSSLPMTKPPTSSTDRRAAMRLNPRQSLTGALRTEVNKHSKKPPVAAEVRSEPWLPRRKLTAVARNLLEALPAEQFVLPRGGKLNTLLDKPGHLDLFSGCRVAAQELANRTGRWVLTYDILHSPEEDLLDAEVQRQISAMLEAGCFLSVTAGPVCASFSRAVRPPVRTADAPEGLSAISENMKIKVAMGNAMATWLAALIGCVIELGLPFWVENPAGSFLWLQPAWRRLIEEYDLQYLLTDYCRWGTPWRKRTRFLGRFSAAGSRYLCTCLRKHVRLVGYSAEHKCCWTKAAEAYPRNLAKFLAATLTESLKPIARQRTIDPGAMAKCGRGRIGEAQNPGPRQARANPTEDLEQVELVRPATLALQARVHRSYLDWLEAEVSSEVWRSLVAHPHLQVMFLRSFGNWLYGQGKAMYLFRHLVVFLQQQFPAVRHQIIPAWELLARWELVLPVSHRPPLPKLVLDVVCSLALACSFYHPKQPLTLQYVS